MSDLHCPARIVLARQGQAEYETEVLTDHVGSLTTVGRAQARALGESLRHEKVAHVYASTLSASVQTAELAAGVLGVEVTRREELVEAGVGGLFEELADVHRGETVLVVCDADVMAATLAALAGRRGTSAIGNCWYTVLEADADGWRLTADLSGGSRLRSTSEARLGNP